MRWILLLVWVFCSIYAFGQKISGQVNNAAGQPVSDCYVLLLDAASGQIILYAIPNQAGEYTLETPQELPFRGLLRCQGMAYETQEKPITITEEQPSMEVYFTLQPRAVELEEVVIISERPKMVINNDTITYDVAQYAREGDLRVLDLLRRLPGFEVNERTGEITYKGKVVETLLLDGEDLFGRGYSVGVRNIPIKIIDKVEAIEDYHTNKLEKGLRRSEKVAINLKLKQGVSALTGEIVAGVGLKDYVGKGSAILLHDKHKGFGVAETNNISYNTTSFEEETYNSENAEEINLYSFDPLANSLVKAMPSFERSYDNRLRYGQYAHRVKLGKKSSLRGNLSGFTDFTRTQQQTDTRFILNDQERFRQTNDQDTHGSPTFSVIALEWQNELSDSSFLRYNFRHSRKQLRITQQNLQNGNTWFQSQLQTDRSFFYNQAQYSNRISATSLLNVKVSYAQDFFDQSLAVTTTELIPVSGTPGYDALLNTRRQETSIAASYLKKITRGDIEFSLHQNWWKDQFTFLPAGGIPYGFVSKFWESKFQSLFNYTLWPKGKVSAQAEGIYADQILFENGITTLGKQQTWVLNSNIRFLITPNPSSKIIVEGIRHSTPPLVQYLHRANIFADSRTFFTNQPGYAWQTTWNSRISFRRDDLTTQSSQHLSFGYQTADNNYLANQEIDSLIFLITWFQFPSNRRTVVGAGGYSFLIDPLSLLISLRGNTSFNWYFTQLNSNVVRKTVNQTTGLQVGINSAFTGVFNFRWRIEASFLTGTQEDAPTIRNRIWTNELTAHFKWGKNTQFRLTQQAILPEQAFQWRNQLFFDININHQIPQKKMECFLMARNIFNRDQYVQIQTTEFSRTVMATSLFRKFLVVGIQLNL